DLWWDSIRFEVCYCLYDCLTGATYSQALRPGGRSRAIGRARRGLERLALFADARLRHRDLMVVRAARSVAADKRRHDVVLDPIIDLLPDAPLVIDTVPRRYHLPDVGHLPPANLAARIVQVLDALLETFAIDERHRQPLFDLTAQVRAEYTSQLAGYHRLFAAARPRAILMVQNGVARSLFTAANVRGIPTAEAQHGLIGFGHPGYSYPTGVDYSRQSGLPSLFLTFSNFWSEGTYYPAGRHVVVGTDHFAAGMKFPPQGLGVIMVITAGVYHGELIALTRDFARQLPARRIVYKLHPGQWPDESSIRAELADLPNVAVGSANIPAAAMMDDVTHLVAIQSTVVYEALQTGRRIVIVPRQNYHLHADIFDRSEVTVAESPDAMANALAVPADGGPGPLFFERFDPVRVRALIETELLGRP
ncbi:hypothetical protein ACBY01_11665, partial [Sphingomonas sp. ac-8]|uniref:hypothetical protein n=1 Tax=Sphingomonas sp. ac-8 TaxID=3242977 RepID=UPI003A7F76EC